MGVDGAVLTSYSSATCKATDVLQTATFGYGCAYRVATDYYATDFYSVAIDCVEGTTAAAVLGGLDGRYALQKYVSRSLCGCGWVGSFIRCSPVATALSVCVCTVDRLIARRAVTRARKAPSWRSCRGIVSPSKIAAFRIG